MTNVICWNTVNPAWVGKYYSLLSECTSSSFCLFVPLLAKQVLKADEAGGVGGSMLPGLVGDGELTQVVSSNLGLGFHPVKVLQL